MKRSTYLTILMVLTIGLALPVAGQKDDYSGKWKLNRDKSTTIENTPILVKINVQIKSDSLLTERVYDTGDGQEYPFIENLTLDGKEYEINIYNMPRKAKATIAVQDTVINLESVITFEGSNGPGDFVSKETWKVDKEKNILTISFKNKTPDGDTEGAFVFNREEQ